MVLARTSTTASERAIPRNAASSRSTFTRVAYCGGDNGTVSPAVRRPRNPGRKPGNKEGAQCAVTITRLPASACALRVFNSSCCAPGRSASKWMSSTTSSAGPRKRLLNSWTALVSNASVSSRTKSDASHVQYATAEIDLPDLGQPAGEMRLAGPRRTVEHQRVVRIVAVGERRADGRLGQLIFRPKRNARGPGVGSGPCPAKVGRAAEYQGYCRPRSFRPTKERGGTGSISFYGESARAELIRCPVGNAVKAPRWDRFPPLSTVRSITAGSGTREPGPRFSLYAG